jgi:hypothetical protein
MVFGFCVLFECHSLFQLWMEVYGDPVVLQDYALTDPNDMCDLLAVESSLDELLDPCVVADVPAD